MIKNIDIIWVKVLFSIEMKTFLLAILVVSIGFVSTGCGNATDVTVSDQEFVDSESSELTLEEVEFELERIKLEVER